MTKRYWQIGFTPAVQALQEQDGSAANYRPGAPLPDDRLTARETDFIAARDGFYLGTVTETGWPYVQFRGGPAGFVHVVADGLLAFADLRGNRQWISAGNLRGDDRVSLFFMDYRHRRRLKLFGHMRHAAPGAHPDIDARVQTPALEGAYERLALVRVTAFDWNCPQHIPQRLTLAECEQTQDPLRAELARLQAENARLQAQAK